MDPYRTFAMVPMIPQDTSEHILFVYGNKRDTCPVCGKEERSYNYGEQHKEKFCTPFHRVILKWHMFKHNLVCNLPGAHFHCWCFNKNCKTHWVVIREKDLDVKEI